MNHKISGLDPVVSCKNDPLSKCVDHVHGYQCSPTNYC